MTKKAANHRHLLGAPVRDHIIDEVRTYVDAAGKMGKIVSIAVDGNAEVEVYIRNQARMAAGVGPVTVAVLMRNAKTAHMRQTQIGWRA